MASKNETEKSVVLPKNAADIQRFKLEKLMKNPAKEVFIPDKSQEKEPRPPHEFIRNVWGSSAGAGSGDFHVYRGVRRREYARQKFLTEKFEKDNANADYHKKLEENQKAADQRTAKKRAKRQKRKQKLKEKKMKTNDKKEEDNSDKSEDDEEEDEDDDNDDKKDENKDDKQSEKSDCTKDYRTKESDDKSDEDLTKQRDTDS